MSFITAPKAGAQAMNRTAIPLLHVPHQGTGGVAITF